MNNIAKIADKLRQTWNDATGDNRNQTWESASPNAKRGYLAVARAAVECACERQYRDLTHEDIIQAGDEVWAFGTGPWEPVSPRDYGQQYRNGYNKMRRKITAEKQYRNLVIGELIQKGDEVSSNGSPWEPVTEFMGCTYQNRNFSFRRPVPSQQKEKVAHLQDVIADQRREIEHLEKKLSEEEQFRKDLAAAQSCNLSYSKKIDELRIVNKTLQDGLGAMSDGWGAVIRFVIDNQVGVVGQPFPDIVLRMLQEQINWKGQTDEKVKFLSEKLNKATAYIDGLESDLSFYNTLAELFTLRLEGAKHGE